jgi:hypothetical protein
MHSQRHFEARIKTENVMSSAATMNMRYGKSVGTQQAATKQHARAL